MKIPTSVVMYIAGRHTTNTLASSINTKLFIRDTILNAHHTLGPIAPVDSIQSDRVLYSSQITDLFKKHLNNNKESINLGSIKITIKRR